MNQVKLFLKNINILNLLLLIVVIFLFNEINGFLNYKKIDFTLSNQKEIIEESEEETKTENTVNYMNYVSILENNLFHPTRKISSGTKEEPQTSKPEIVLYGTFITDEKRIAYIEDKKSPYSTPGRGKRQVAVNEGSMVAGYKLIKINPESITLVRGDDSITVLLNSKKERKDNTTSSSATLDSTTRSMQSLSQSQANTNYKPQVPPKPNAR